MTNAKMLLMIWLVLSIAPALYGQSNWYQIARPTTRNLNKASFIDSAHGWVAGDYGTILKTTNGGKNWSVQNAGSTDDIKYIFMFNERIGWAISWQQYVDTSTYFGSTLLKTTNGGTTWSGTQFPEHGNYFYTLIFFDSLNGLIGGSGGGIQRTTNGGARWTNTATDSSAATGFAIRNITFYSRQYGFAMGGIFDITGSILRTTNGGEYWTGSTVSPEPVFEVHYIDSAHVVGITGDYEYGPSMIKTKDGGDQWEYIYLGFWGLPRAMAFRTPAEGWVPIANQIMVTRDTARTWQIEDTLGSRQLSDLVFIDSLTGYAVGDSGAIFKYSSKPLGVSENSMSPPLSSHLMENYPNPFNPATTIRFRVAPSQRNEKTILTVLDLLGREVTTLVNGEKTAGDYSVVWDARSFSSGVYFYKLQSGSVVDVKKMLLIR